MKFLKWTGIALLAVIAVALAVGFFLPRTVHVERTVVIARPQATVYAVVSDWRQFNEWSPWAEVDPDAEYTYEGEPGEVGSKMTWKGDGQAGTGSQEIIEARPYERVVSRLVFGEDGEEGEAITAFTALEVDGGTELIWSFEYETGPAPWERWFGLMMESMVGSEYEKGLEKLKAYVEDLPRADFAMLDAEIVDVEPMPVAYTTMRTAANPDAIGEGYQEGYEAVWAFMQENELSPAGMPLGINTSSTEEEVVFDAAMPISRGVPNPEDGPVKIGTTYGGKALRAVHTGPYSGLEDSYAKIRAYMAAHRLERNGRTWEHFVTDPGEVPESELVTHIYVPVKQDAGG
ncbi:MAG: SRPBCC family protein [Alphaproteobacteria bacterium]